MQTFTIKADDSFKFTSKLACDPSEVFTAFTDHYKEGYIVIDSKSNAFILDISTVEYRLLKGDFTKVTEDVGGKLTQFKCFNFNLC